MTDNEDTRVKVRKVESYCFKKDFTSHTRNHNGTTEQVHALTLEYLILIQKHKFRCFVSLKSFL